MNLIHAFQTTTKGTHCNMEMYIHLHGNTEFVLNGNVFKQNKNCKTLYRYRHFYSGFGQLIKFLVMKIFFLLLVLSIICIVECL